MTKDWAPWQRIENLPDDGIERLFYGPGSKMAYNPWARLPYRRIDVRNARWPRFRFEYPEAPYTHFRELPPGPDQIGEE